MCASASGVHPHRCLQIVVCLQVVGGISLLTRGAAITSEAEQGSADRAPLCLSQGDGAEVKGQDVGADGHRVVCC
jgi:hypothetical protein